MNSDDPRLLELWMDLAEDGAEGDIRPLADYLARHAELEEAAVADAWLTARSPQGNGSEADGARRIGPYRLDAELGRGGQGVVYRAEHVELGRSVALKLLAPGAIGGDTARLRFEREAMLAARLEHPGLGTVYEAGRADDVDFLAMQLLTGGSLADGLARDRAADSTERPGRALRRPYGGGEAEPSTSERAALEHAVQMVADAARALHAAHQAGVVHRDVKPSNLLFDSEGRPVWVDFGLARDASRAALTLSGEQLGTPAYMAPEQIDGSAGALDARTDVWGLGALLYEVLTLSKAFDRPSVEATLFAICTDTPAPLRTKNPRAPRDLEVICATALERDRKRRYESAGALADDLERFLERRPIEARPAPTWLRIWRAAQRSPAGAAALVVALVATALIGGLVGGFRAERRGLETQRDAAIDGQAQLTDREVAEALVREAEEELWPIAPELVERAEHWLAELDSLEAGVARHHETLAELERRTGDGDPAEARLADFLRELLASVESARGGRADVALRLDRARDHAARSVEHADWPACIDAVRESPRYRGVELSAQMGLVPLGVNAAGLWEFWHVESGERPAFEAGVGARAEPESGLVLVLLPGGTFAMGCHPEEGPNLDPRAQQNEIPQHELDLDPFFASKFELTQSQWLRAMGDVNPSAYPIGHLLGELVIATATSPVETVDRSQAERCATRLGLELPTEAQWEYAARGGTHTPYSFGEDLTRATQFANTFGDEARPFTANHYLADVEIGRSDLHVRHAPVGSFAPNPFGLHDVHGNVFEWCRDGYAPYSEEPRPGDGLRADPAQADRGVVRGSGYLYPADVARIARRAPQSPDAASSDLGLRPVRPLDP